jgi:hypothetical protein
MRSAIRKYASVQRAMDDFARRTAKLRIIDLVIGALVLSALAAGAHTACAEFGSNGDRGYSSPSGPTGRANDRPNWTWSAWGWSDQVTGQGARRNGILNREIGADEIDRGNRLGHGQGGPSGGAASRGGGNFGADGSNNK